jgi:hypothetical protein
MRRWIKENGSNIDSLLFSLMFLNSTESHCRRTKPEVYREHIMIDFTRSQRHWKVSDVNDTELTWQNATNFSYRVCKVSPMCVAQYTAIRQLRSSRTFVIVCLPSSWTAPVTRYCHALNADRNTWSFTKHHRSSGWHLAIGKSKQSDPIQLLPPRTGGFLNLNSVNQLIFVMVKCGVLFEVRTEFLNNI